MSAVDLATIKDRVDPRDMRLWVWRVDTGRWVRRFPIDAVEQIRAGALALSDPGGSQPPSSIVGRDQW